MSGKKHRVTYNLRAGTIAILEAVAKYYGCVAASGGPRHGKPSITQLLEAIAIGRLVIAGPAGGIARAADGVPYPEPQIVELGIPDGVAS